MEPIQNHINEDELTSYKPSEYEKEQASNSYLMSVVAIIVGLPLPIINLLATALFFFGNLKKSKFIRWHCTQALLSQLTIFLINSIGYAWTLNIIFSEKTEPTNSYFAYLTVLIIFNLVEFIASIMLAVKVRKGIHVQWWLWGSLTNNIFSSNNREKNITQFLIRTIVLIALLGGSFYALAQLPWVETLNVNEFTAKKKEQLGNIILDTYRTGKREITGPVQPIIKEIKDKICLANGIDTASINIHVFADSETNAFAIPGDHIIVNTGLIDFCDDPDMVAGVIAHEIGHIQKDHVSKKLSKEIGISTLVMLAGGTQNMGLIKEILKTLTSKKFDRDYETEADEAALEYLQQAKIDPLALADFFEQIAQKGGSLPEALEWISTHPEPEERAARIKTELNSTINYSPSLTEEQWKTLKAKTNLYDHI
ncbi:MAG: M48 family metallopeptidase [Flavipsychrobacter sp.]